MQSEAEIMPIDRPPRKCISAIHAVRLLVDFACVNDYPSYATWGRMIGAALKLEPVIVLPLLYPVPWLVGRSNELISRLRNRSNSLNSDCIREATVESWACSPSSACSKLGFNAKRPLLNQHQATAMWYRESGWL